jgi:signal transduction histidine kinase
VLGFATELADSWDMFSAEEARGLVQLIARQSADISGIVDDLLTITRLEAGTMSVYPKSIEVGEHIRGLVDTLGREANRTVECRGDASVWADPARIRQVIRNLVTNAFRHGGERVHIKINPVENGAHVEVRDSGGPIPDARVQTMFNPFDRSDDGIRTPNSVGLGLAVARSLARMMGGDLEYLYEDDESVFRLSLRARARLPE